VHGSGPSHMAPKEMLFSRKLKRPRTVQPMLRCLNQNAAGIDVGATEVYIAVPPERDAQPVRRFATFTEDLHAAANWLKACQIKTVAMESTGVHWIPLFWLGLCPDNRISGGKVLFVKTRQVKNRAAMALRIAAQSLHRSHSSLGQYYRRMRAKLGTPKAITAVAHKLARIIYHLLTTGKAYDESICAKHDLQYHQRFEARLRKQASALGFDLMVRQTCTS